MSGYVEGKDKNQILNELVGTAEPGSRTHEQQKMGIIVRCTEDLEKALYSLQESMNKNAQSSDKLATKVYWLNIVLATATVIGTLLALVRFFFTNS